jgi:acyl-coenzyme A thioesterase PaaI-like protein
LKTSEEVFPSNYGRDVHHKKCFGCGLDNPLSLRADFKYDSSNRQVKFIYNFNINYMGPPGHVHGGILSTILDEAMGVLCFHLGYFVMTDEMSFKFLKATPIETDILVRSWVVGQEKRKMSLECMITNLEENFTYVTGKGIFHILPERYFKNMPDELTGDKDYSSVLKKNKEARNK